MEIAVDMMPDVLNNKVEESAINETIKALGGIQRTADQLTSLRQMKRVLPRKKLDFVYLKDWINETQKLKARKEQLLLEWLDVCEKASSGKGFPRDMLKKQGWNHQPTLTDESAHIIRQIIYSYNVKPSKFNGLLNSFAVLLLGRHLELDEFVSTSTISYWLERLARIDKAFRAEEDKELFTKKSKYGFPIL